MTLLFRLHPESNAILPLQWLEPSRDSLISPSSCTSQICRPVGAVPLYLDSLLQPSQTPKVAHVTHKKEILVKQSQEVLVSNNSQAPSESPNV